MSLASQIRANAPDQIEFRFDPSNALPVIPVRGEDYDGWMTVVPNEGHNIRPTLVVVTVKMGDFSVEIRGEVVNKDGSVNRKFSAGYVLAYGHKDIKQAYAEMVAERLGLTLISRF